MHEITGEQPHYLMFHRRAPRRIEVKLPQLDQDKDITAALETVRKTNQEKANTWRAKANVGRKKTESREKPTG